jgi:hypothetical protein
VQVSIFLHYGSYDTISRRKCHIGVSALIKLLDSFPKTPKKQILQSHFIEVSFTVHNTWFKIKASTTIGIYSILYQSVYRSSLHDLFFDRRKSIPSEYYKSTLSDEIMQKVSFLVESLSYCDALFRPHISGCLLSKFDIQDIISFPCTD